MENFDFDQMHTILKILHDNVPIDKEGLRFVFDVPSVYELKDVARRLLRETIEEELQFCATRYLKVSKFKFTDYPDDYELWLDFDCLGYVSECQDELKSIEKENTKEETK